MGPVHLLARRTCTIATALMLTLAWGGCGARAWWEQWEQRPTTQRTEDNPNVYRLPPATPTDHAQATR